MKKDLKKWQREIRLSSVKLADELRMTKQTVHNLRSGKTKPSEKTLKALSRVVKKYDPNPFPAEFFFLKRSVVRKINASQT